AILDWRRLYVERRERAAAVQQAHEQAARRALRQWVWALAAMTVLALVGWVAAHRQRLLAEANQKAAEKNQTVAEANQKAAESMAASAHYPGRGLELALAAVKKTNDDQLPPTGTSEDALRRAIQASRLQWSLSVGDWVSDVAFTADGRHLAIGSWAERQFNPDQDPTLRLVDLGDGRPVLKAARSILHPNWVQAVALPRVGDRLATMAGNSVWLRALDQTDAAPRMFTPGTSTLSALAVSTDAARLAAANRGERFITIWDLDPASSQPPVAIDTGGQWVKGLAFSPDGCCLASAAVERGSRSRSFTEIWCVRDGKKMLRVPNLDPSDAVAFAPDGKWLVTASRDNRVRVWRLADVDLDALVAECGATDTVPPPPVCAADAVEPQSMRWLQPIRWVTRELAGHLERVRDVAVSPDGTRIASAGGDGAVIIWDAETGEHLLTLTGHRGYVETVAFTPDGQQVVSGGRDGTVKLWNVTGHTGGVYGIAFSRDGNQLATASGDRTAMLWDLTGGTPRLRHTLRGHTETVYRLAFDRDGHRLATAGFDGAMLWDVASGDRLQTFEGHRDQLRDLAISPDGTLLATVAADGTGVLRPLDETNTAVPAVIVNHNAKKVIQTSAVAFHPHQPLWVTAGWDGMLQQWDFAGNHRGTIADPSAGGRTPRRFVSVAFSPDGAEIAALAGKKVSIWPATAFGQAPAPHSVDITVSGTKLCSALAYDRAGARLAVACDDSGVRIYDAKTRAAEPLKVIFVHTDAVNQAVFSPDGSTLATASVDKTFSVSPLSFDALYDVATRLSKATGDGK
ncbi:MAG TPA: WD40 repeat domain-containing protein, partial [Candidatus Dormibacteraeota bacterium]|nr:WD40 repeat domain-containing protein [Candidatus Dormibacteraeota bacterium]